MVNFVKQQEVHISFVLFMLSLILNPLFHYNSLYLKKKINPKKYYKIFSNLFHI